MQKDIKTLLFYYYKMRRSLHLPTTSKQFYNPIVRRSIFRLPQIRHLAIVRIADETTILADYLSVYSEYICGSKIISCIDNLVLPPSEEQLRILQALYEISTRVNTEELDGIFIKLLLMHDDKGIEMLIESLQQHQESTKIINSIIAYARKIPISPMEQ